MKKIREKAIKRYLNGGSPKEICRSQTFVDFNDLFQKARDFEQFHNQNQRYSTLGGLTPYHKCIGIYSTTGKINYFSGICPSHPFHSQ